MVILFFFVFSGMLIITILILWWCNWKGIASQGYDDLDDTNVNNTTQPILRQPLYPLHGGRRAAKYCTSPYRPSIPMPLPQPDYPPNAGSPYPPDGSSAPYSPGGSSAPYPPDGGRALYPPDGDCPPYPPGPAPASVPYSLADPESVSEDPPPPYDVAVQLPTIYKQ